jgi:glutamate-1-semialdehyde 2,1-aminomutase
VSDHATLYARSLKVAPGGVHSPVRAFRSVGGLPIFIERSWGPMLIDVSGRTFIDFCQSFGPLLLGHRDADVQAASIEALKDGWTYGCCESHSLALAEWITARVPWVEKIRFVSSGTEAVMSALRVARAATGRSRVLKFDGCYHGHADAMLVRAGSGLAGQRSSIASSPRMGRRSRPRLSNRYPRTTVCCRSATNGWRTSPSDAAAPAPC